MFLLVLSVAIAITVIQAANLLDAIPNASIVPVTLTGDWFLPAQALNSGFSFVQAAGPVSPLYPQCGP